MWVQIWNLPVHWISKETGIKIGKIFSEAKNIIIPLIGGKEGRHIKISVDVDVTQPFIRGTTVKVNGVTKWVDFRYENAQTSTTSVESLAMLTKITTTTELICITTHMINLAPG
ncbi:hypothetical protein ACH5RR_004372 [Cinchona calisaya]|uniref:DUF4283 domain-containing protein n=1 Tax=Cinchona calisaya TaxID=153742 RepID=A0ABD3AXU7_9GENT